MDPSLHSVAALLTGTASALLICHVSPDGDTIGAGLGLAWALRRRGAMVRVVCADPVPEELRFLPGAEGVGTAPWQDEQVIICIDASDSARLGPLYDAEVFAAVPVVNIDHHVTNVRYATHNLVWDVASTAEVIVALIGEMGLPLEATTATCLLAGVLTDTLGFRTSNTTAGTLRAAAELVEVGAPLFDVSQAVFNHRRFAVLRLWGAVVASAHLEGPLLWAEVPQALVREHGGDAQATKGLINHLSTAVDPQVVALFREVDERQVEVGFRSRPGYDVSGIALSFGGGGHPQAAGCLVAGTLHEVRDRMLPLLRDLARAEIH